MGLFTLDLNQIDWTKTKDLGLFALAGYAAVVSTINLRRGKQRIEAEISTYPVVLKRDGSCIITISVVNKGNTSFSVRWISVREADQYGRQRPRGRTIYNMVADTADDLTIEPGKKRKFECPYHPAIGMPKSVQVESQFGNVWEHRLVSTDKQYRQDVLRDWLIRRFENDRRLMIVEGDACVGLFHPQYDTSNVSMPISLASLTEGQPEYPNTSEEDASPHVRLTRTLARVETSGLVLATPLTELNDKWSRRQLEDFAAPAPDIDVCGDPLTQLVLGHASGSDTELFVKQLSDPFGTPNGNRGLYGVDCNFAYKIRNKCDEVHEAFAFIMARNTGPSEEVPGKFWGAAHLISTATPQQPEIGVDLIQYGDPLDGCCRVSAAGPLIIPAKSIEGYNGPIDALLRFAVGGASDLPVNFVSSNHDIVPGP